MSLESLHPVEQIKHKLGKGRDCGRGLVFHPSEGSARHTVGEVLNLLPEFGGDHGGDVAGPIKVSHGSHCRPEAVRTVVDLSLIVAVGALWGYCFWWWYQ